jgi:hypothetical protein
MRLGNEYLCDRCFNRRMAQWAGLPDLPDLPDPPPPISLPDAQVNQRLMNVTIRREPAGVVVALEVADQHPGEGFRFSVIGDHYADVDDLVARVTAAGRAEMGRQYLEKDDPLRGGWRVRGPEVAGRLEWSGGGEGGTPHVAVVDGMTLSWEELGKALDAYEGFRFRLVLEDPSDVVER